MDYALTFVFFAVCLGLLLRLLRARDVVDFQLGIIAAFSIGYFCLPVWFKPLSNLGHYSDADLARAVLIFMVFASMVVLGTWAGRRVIRSDRGLRTENLDALLIRRRGRLVVFAFMWFVYYYFSQALTSYASDDLVYFQRSGGTSAIMAAAADIALGWIALSVALAIRERRRFETVVYILLLGVCLCLLLLVGQRLAFLTPLVMLMALLSLTGQARNANRMLVMGVIALILVSPVAVAVREAPPGTSATETLTSFSYGSNPFQTMFQSIIDRGDLLYVTVRMMPVIEDDPLPGATYYGSVLTTPIPAQFFPGESKPYLLSTDGSPSGELSIYAWQQLRGGGEGSLSAFGGLVAYRELGWPGVVLNGLLTGVLFVFLARWLGRGGMLPMVLFAGLFVSLSVKKVPPSLWEAVGSLMPILPFVVVIVLLEKALTPRRRAGIQSGPPTSN